MTLLDHKQSACMDGKLSDFSPFGSVAAHARRDVPGKFLV
jgi:hypothetical protein